MSEFPFGSIIGSGAGLAVSGLTGLPPSLTVPLGQAGGNLIQGAIDGNKAKLPPLTDPSQMAQMVAYRQIADELKNKQKALESGATYLPQQESIKQTGQNAMAKVLQSGGSTGATLAGLSFLNRGTGRNLNDLYTTMTGQANQMSLQGLRVQQLMSDLNDRMATRKLNLQSYKYSQDLANAMNMQKSGMEGLNAVLADKSGKIDNLFNPQQTIPPNMSLTATGQPGSPLYPNLGITEGRTSSWNPQMQSLPSTQIPVDESVFGI